MNGQLAFVGLVVDVIAVFVSGFCGMILWNWYVPLIFETAPQLTFILAIGLSLVASAFVSSSRTYDIEEFDDDTGITKCILNQVMSGISKPIWLVVMGAIVNIWI